MDFKQIVSSDKTHDLQRPRRPYVPKSQQIFFVKRWQESGISRKEFCKHHNIHTKTFSNWFKHVRVQDKRKPLSNTVQQKQPSSSPRNDRLELKFSNGNLMSITGAIEQEFILSIIQGISKCSSS